MGDSITKNIENNKTSMNAVPVIHKWVTAIIGFSFLIYATWLAYIAYTEGTLFAIFLWVILIPIFVVLGLLISFRTKISIFFVGLASLYLLNTYFYELTIEDTIEGASAVGIPDFTENSLFLDQILSPDFYSLILALLSLLLFFYLWIIRGYLR